MNIMHKCLKSPRILKSTRLTVVLGQLGPKDKYEHKSTTITPIFTNKQDLSLTRISKGHSMK